MDEKTRQQVREAIADHEAAHPHWRQERRDREIAEAQAAEARRRRAAKEQQQAVQRRHQNTTQNWAAWVNQRIAAAAQADRESLVRVIGEVISIERAKHRKEIQTAVAETTRAFESKLERLEEKLIAQPGQLPMAKFWYPETVVYRGEIVTHEGETFQAKKDTASRPPGPDWFLVARAGRDATMPQCAALSSRPEATKRSTS